MAFAELLRQICGKNGWDLEGEEATVSLPDGRSQVIHWQLFRHEQKDMARLYSFIGSSELLSQTRLEAAMRLNFSLPHGALAIHGGKLALTETFLVSDADADEVEASIRFLAEMADRYEKLIYGSDQH